MTPVGAGCYRYPAVPASPATPGRWLDETPTGWDAAKATNAAQTWLTTYPDLKAIGCISDSLCLAADSVASSMGMACAERSVTSSRRRSSRVKS